MSEEAISKELEVLRKQVGQVRAMVQFTVAAVVLILAVANAKALYALPHLEKVYQDMLGSTSKLPELTQSLLLYGQLPNFACWWITGGVALLPLLMMMAWKRSVFPVFVAMVVVVLLFLQWMALETGMNLPLVRVIQGIGAV